jgi:hypothetical protein
VGRDMSGLAKKGPWMDESGTLFTTLNTEANEGLEQQRPRIDETRRESHQDKCSKQALSAKTCALSVAISPTDPIRALAKTRN